MRTNKHVVRICAVVMMLFFVASLTMASANVTMSNKAPEKGTVIVMMEDGWRDQYTNAVPILEANGFKATFDVYTDGMDINPNTYMTWDELTTLYGYGYDMGSHTIHHYNLNAVSNKTLYNEVSYSKQVFLMHGIQVNEIALPYDQGQDNATVIKAVQDAGFLMMRSNNVVMNMQNNSKVPLQILWMNNAADTSILNGLNATVTILLYHHISDDASDKDATSPQQFSDQMAMLKNNSYSVKTFSEAFFTVTPIEGPLPTPTPYPLFESVNSIGLIVLGAVAVAVALVLIITIVKRRRNK